MLENIKVNWHSSVRIEGKKGVIYVDPRHIDGEVHDADVICITHKHADHFLPEDVAKVANAGTLVLAPVGMEEEVLEKVGLEDVNFEFLEPEDEIDIDDINIRAVPSYNVNKDFHKKEYGWLGYVIDMEGAKYYIAGDTDDNEDIRKVQCDVAMIPIGGKYTMDPSEAAAFINAIKPKYAIPIHYGCIEETGTLEDGMSFASRISSDTEVVFKLG